MNNPPNKVWETDISNKPEHSLVGLTEKEITEFCNRCNYKFRVSCRDGKFYVLTRDFRGDRINVDLEDGIVSKVWVG